MKITKPMLIAFCFLLFVACSLSPAGTPTATPRPSSTAMPTFTATASSTPTLTPEPTNTLTSTPACLAADGDWESLEASGFMGPNLTFTVLDCEITDWQVNVYPVPGELLFWPGSSAIPIAGDQFAYDEDTGDGVFSLRGSFDSSDMASGTLDFPKGFSVFGTILKTDVSIPWTAILKD